jgi:Zn-finger nucleic acid-binding protein
MVFFPLVLCWVCGWCILHLRVLKNNEVELNVFPRTSHGILLRMGDLTSTVKIHGRVMCLETP